MTAIRSGKPERQPGIQLDRASLLASLLVLLAPLLFDLTLIPSGILPWPGATAGTSGGAAEVAGVASQDQARATAAYAALQRSFAVPGSHLYREQLPWDGGNSYSYLWPFSHLLAATISLSQLPAGSHDYGRDLQDQLTGLELYWDPSGSPPAYLSYVPPPYGVGGDRFYDDNVWIGLELAEIARQTGDQAALTRAEQVFDFMLSGWDGDPTHPDPGGIFWVDAGWDHQRSTVSTAFAALLGFQLYEQTHQQRFLDQGRMLFDWTNSYMLAPDGLYWDHVDLNGAVDTWENSYNQGAMIGANLSLYRITQDPQYRNRAVAIADAALARYGDFTGPGAQKVFTNVIFFDNLLQLAAVTCTPGYLAAAQRYADRLTGVAEAAPDGLLRTDPVTVATLLDQASLVELDARLAATTAGCAAGPAAPPAP